MRNYSAEWTLARPYKLLEAYKIFNESSESPIRNLLNKVAESHPYEQA